MARGLDQNSTLAFSWMTRGVLTTCELTRPEVGVGGVRLDATEDDSVEDIEHIGADNDLQAAANPDVATHAQILVERAPVPEPEGERPWRIAEGIRRRAHECRPVDERWRVGSGHVAFAPVVVDADRAREGGIEVGVAGSRIREVAGGAERAERPSRSELRDARHLPAVDTCAHQRIAAAPLVLASERQIVDGDGVQDVRLIVGTHGPILLHVVPGPCAKIVLGPAEGVVEVHGQPVEPTLLERQLQRMIGRARDVAVHIGDARILRKWPQHLANGAGEVGIRQADAGHDRACGRKVGGVGRLRQQVPQREILRVELIRVIAATRATEEVALAAGVGRADGGPRCQGVGRVDVCDRRRVLATGRNLLGRVLHVETRTRRRAPRL